MGGEEDRQYLSSLTHLEREKVLEERHTKRQQLIRQSELLKSIKENDEGKDDPNSLFGVEGLNKRQFSQLKDDSNTAILPVKKIKEHDSPNKSKNRKRKGDHSNSESLNPTEDLRKLNNICLKRSLLLKLHDHLYFEEAVRDCLVKINMGNQNGRGVYKIGIIKGVSEKSKVSYNYEGKAYSKFLDIAFDAGSMASISLINISNKEIDEREAFKLLEDLRDVTEFPLNTRWVERKQEELKKFVNYRFTGEDIMKINERNLDKIKEAKGGSLISKKKLLEEKVNYLESENFLKFSQDRYDEIHRLRKEITSINQQIILEQQAHINELHKRGNYEKFMEWKSVC